jgi:hypothetical protein
MRVRPAMLHLALVRPSLICKGTVPNFWQRRDLGANFGRGLPHAQRRVALEKGLAQGACSGAGSEGETRADRRSSTWIPCALDGLLAGLVIVGDIGGKGFGKGFGFGHPTRRRHCGWRCSIATGVGKWSEAGTQPDRNELVGLSKYYVLLGLVDKQ